MGKHPYMQFFTGDWKKNPKVARCSLATRGVWLELLFAMHDDGAAGKMNATFEQLARFARCSVPEIEAALAELKLHNVAEIWFGDVTQASPCDKNVTPNVTPCDKIVTLVSRRMDRDYNERNNHKLRQSRYRDKCRENAKRRENDGRSSYSYSYSSSEHQETHKKEKDKKETQFALSEKKPLRSELPLFPIEIPIELKGLALYEVDQKLLKHWPKVFPAWVKAYPGLNVPKEIAQAHAWELANPERQKTLRTAFLNRWLSRAQDNHGGQHAKRTPKERDYSDARTGEKL